MLKKYYLPLLFLSACIGLTAGCGSDNGAVNVTKLAASEPCIGCHGANTSPGTEHSIVEEWRLSTHNTANGAGCADCHEPGPSHPDNCGKCHGGSSAEVTRNPDAAQKCYKCHGLSHPDDVMIKNAPQHFGNMTASTNNSTYRASYVSSQYVGKCRNCHNPHNPIDRSDAAKSIHEQWADSGLGDTTANARISYDFKTRGTYEPVNLSFQYYCERCHTTTGYIKYVASNFTDQTPFAGLGFAVVQNTPQDPNKPSSDKTKEVTACNACHDDGNGRAYGFNLRAVPQVRVYYNYSSTATSPTLRLNDTPRYYPDAGASNMCVICHAGRGIGQMIKDAAAAGYNFRNASRISGHDFTGAATLFRKSGYEYANRDYDSSASGFLHDRIGLNNTAGTGVLGPCITCHMKSSEAHSFAPVAFDTPLATDPTASEITGIKSYTCSNCHNGTLKPSWTPQGLQARRGGFQAALSVLNGMLAMPAINVKSSTRNWEALYGAGTGFNTMGAYFNYDLLKNDWGAYAHNDLYAKRLICDTLDWLYDGKPDVKTNTGGYVSDVEAAINSVTTATHPWRSAPAYTYTNAELIQLKVDAITYLLGGAGGTRP